VSNRFLAFEDLDEEVKINNSCETIRENIKNFSQRESRFFFN
jgi:hypothetical protein